MLLFRFYTEVLRFAQEWPIDISWSGVTNSKANSSILTGICAVPEKVLRNTPTRRRSWRRATETINRGVCRWRGLRACPSRIRPYVRSRGFPRFSLSWELLASREHVEIRKSPEPERKLPWPGVEEAHISACFSVGDYIPRYSENGVRRQSREYRHFHRGLCNVVKRLARSGRSSPRLVCAFNPAPFTSLCEARFQSTIF